VILDTCTLLSLASGDRRLSRGTRDRLGNAPFRGFSSISAFEIACNHRQGMLELPVPPLAWIVVG